MRVRRVGEGRGASKSRGGVAVGWGEVVLRGHLLR